METGKTVALTIGVVVVLLALLGYLFYGSSNAPVVSVAGQSTITVQPDKASVYLNIESRASNAKDAKDNVFKSSDDVLTSLIKLGIERKDIQTAEITTYPEYDWNSGSQKLKGYVASQQIIVKTTDFNVVDDIVDSSVNSGALVNSINFELSQSRENTYKAQALREAGEDAKARATALAESQGKKLGSLVDISSQEFNYSPYPYYSARGGLMAADYASSNAEAKVAATNIVPKENQVTASVSVRYKLSGF